MDQAGKPDVLAGLFFFGLSTGLSSPLPSASLLPLSLFRLKSAILTIFLKDQCASEFAKVVARPGGAKLNRKVRRGGGGCVDER